MILSNKRKTKAMIRQGGCAGWSAPLLFANPEDRFSHVEIRVSVLYIALEWNLETHTFVNMGLLG